MGGAQPLVGDDERRGRDRVEVDPARIQKRLESRYLDVMVDNLDEAVRLAMDAKRAGRALSIGSRAPTPPTCFPQITRVASRSTWSPTRPPRTTRSTATCRSGLDVAAAAELRDRDPAAYVERACESIVAHVEAMVGFQRAGAAVFDYGNNIRGRGGESGVRGRVRVSRLRAGVHPAAVLRGLRSVSLGRALGRREGHRRHGRARARVVSRTTQPSRAGSRSRASASRFQGLPARICWLKYGERARFGAALNDLVAKGKVSARR